MDTQTIEIIGRNRLVEQLLEAEVEVAFPVRDRGIDLIAYIDTGEQVSTFAACPIQLKVASEKSFSYDQKYEKFPNLLHVVMWNVAVAAAEVTYALTHQDIVAVGKVMGHASSASWEAGRYSSSSPSKKLIATLKPYQMAQEKWRQVIKALQQTRKTAAGSLT